MQGRRERDRQTDRYRKTDTNTEAGGDTERYTGQVRGTGRQIGIQHVGETATSLGWTMLSRLSTADTEFLTRIITV